MKSIFKLILLIASLNLGAQNGKPSYRGVH